MKIQVNTDHNIEGHQGLNTYIQGLVESGLDRHSSHITRVEVHLTDENGGKTGPDDKKCVMEARLEGRQPFAVTCHADTTGKAAEGALDKLLRMIDHTLEKQRDLTRNPSDTIATMVDPSGEV